MTPLLYILLGALLATVPCYLAWGVRRGMPELGEDMERTAARSRRLTATLRADGGGAP
jgi:hypothetical protein